MSIPRCPKAEQLKDYLIQNTQGEVSVQLIQLLNRLWPKESPLSELATMTLENGEVWDKAEAYMIDLVEPASLEHRVKMAYFRAIWSEELAFLK